MIKRYPFLITMVLVVLTAACRKNKNTMVINNEVNSNADSAFIQTVTFPSLDSLFVTADVYHAGKGLPVMILCHQAGYSRGEYKETALKLNQLGFNCIAIDLRSSNEIHGVVNETAKAAKDKNLPTGYLDALQDIRAAVNYAYQLYGRNIILVGSSYSASLVLKIAIESDKVEKVIAFSPGEYFGPKFEVAATVRGLNKPVFITSSKNEAEEVKPLFDMIVSKSKTRFVPQGDGYHGAKALWPANKGNEEYWTALKNFLW